MGEAASRKRWTLIAVLGGSFMLLVDITIVQVALPRIHDDLHAGFSSLQWVIDAYALTLAALLLTSGSLADRFGRKRIFIAGVAIFTFASLLCGVATTPLFLDLALRGNSEGWSSGIIVGAFAGAAVLLVVFLVVELRHPRPMFDLSLFRNPAFTGVSIGTFAIGAGMFALFPYLTLYLQNILGYSPFQGGVLLLPITLLVFVVPLVARTLVARIPQGAVLGCGLALVTLGIGLMYGVDADSRWTVLLPGMLVAGVGIGLSNPSIAQIALGVVKPERAGMASGISNTFRIGGLATGVAALGAILQDRIGARLHELVPSATNAVRNAVASGGTHAPVAKHVATDSFVFALNGVFIAAAATVFVGAVTVFALVRLREIGQARPAAEPAG